MEIKNRILKTGFVKWRELAWFQPEDFKDISTEQFDKLYNSLKANGLVQPFSVWEREDGKQWILDGHIRKRLMTAMESDGAIIPDELPAYWVDLESEVEAKKMVLIYNSHYGDINAKSAHNWLSDMNWADINSQISIKGVEFNFNPTILGEEVIRNATVRDEEPDFQQITFVLSRAQREMILQALKSAQNMTEFQEMVSANENRNGNAISLICEQWLEEQGMAAQ